MVIHVILFYVAFIMHSQAGVLKIYMFTSRLFEVDKHIQKGYTAYLNSM